MSDYPTPYRLTRFDKKSSVAKSFRRCAAKELRRYRYEDASHRQSKKSERRQDSQTYSAILDLLLNADRFGIGFQKLTKPSLAR